MWLLSWWMNKIRRDFFNPILRHSSRSVPIRLRLFFPQFFSLFFSIFVFEFFLSYYYFIISVYIFVFLCHVQFCSKSSNAEFSYQATRRAQPPLRLSVELVVSSAINSNLCVFLPLQTPNKLTRTLVLGLWLMTFDSSTWMIWHFVRVRFFRLRRILFVISTFALLK